MIMPIGAVGHELYYVNGFDGAYGLLYTPVLPTDNWRGDFTRIFSGCGDGNDPVFNLSFDGVCFGNATDGNFVGGGSHLFGEPDSNFPGKLRAYLAVVDRNFVSHGAFYCQDLDDDDMCGGTLSEVVEGDPLRAEPNMSFSCLESPLWLFSPLDDPTSGPGGAANPGWDRTSTETGWGYAPGFPFSARGNWEPSKRAYVFFDGAVRGNPFLDEETSIQGCALRPPTFGAVYHCPPWDNGEC